MASDSAITVSDVASHQLLNLSNLNIVKFTSSNYLAWKLQMEAILIGYDLFKFLDGSYPCSPRSTVDAPNPAYSLWIFQDKLLFLCLCWIYFGTAYFSCPTTIKSKSDELAVLGKPLDHEDLLDIILATLDEEYRAIIDMVEGRDTPITFDELHLTQIQNTTLMHPATANMGQGRSSGGPRPHRTPPLYG
ncbi:hypothetical protein C2S52_014102 [Perilla frutescens var. hirtella]|nr:hypothetical protein C2S52_014102 [Perilla frutescens var. hirtella]